MISVDEALSKILQPVGYLGVEKVYMIEALGRVLAEDIVSPVESPEWDNSAMDGFAVRAEDLKSASVDSPVSLRVTETISAGQFAAGEVKSGEAHQIMTGAPVPGGADTVVKKEDTEFDGEFVQIMLSPHKGQHIRYRGENFHKSEVVLKSGRIITPAEIAMSATIGRAFLPVAKRPSVAILSTGDELKDIDSAGSEKVYDSNSYALASQVIAAGGMPHFLGIALDSLDEIHRKVMLGLKFDLLLVSGGVSVGSYDFVKEAFARAGITLNFWKVAMRPGNPLAFGTAGEKIVFGLPGNPVSAMVTFDQFVRPVILKMMGTKPLFRTHYLARLEEDLSYRKGFRYFLRGVARVEEGRLLCRTTGNQGSGNITSLVEANCIIIKPEHKEHIPAGDTVEIQLLREVS